MAWIKTIGETEATGEVKEAYEHVLTSRGKLSNILKVHSLNPRALQAHLELYMSTVFGKSSLRRADRELIAVVVSAANACPYCIHHHSEALNAYWKDDAKVKSVVEDFRGAHLSEAQLAMCVYADNLTKSPSASQEANIVALRDADFSDEQILNITLITSYFNFVNRIALGLGVGFTGEEVSGYIQ